MDIISLPHTFAAEVQLFCFPFSSTNMIAPGCLATPRLALGMLMGRKSTAKPSPESWSYRAVGIVLTATSHRYHPRMEVSLDRFKLPPWSKCLEPSTCWPMLNHCAHRCQKVIPNNKPTIWGWFIPPIYGERIEFPSTATAWGKRCPRGLGLVQRSGSGQAGNLQDGDLTGRNVDSKWHCMTWLYIDSCIVCIV